MLYGSDSDDRLYGGGGHDQLYGRGGHDQLTDGDRDGTRGAAAPGPDTLDGGPGPDRLSYARRTRTVSVRAGDDSAAGERGEHDRTHSIESIDSGAGDDRLVGDRGANWLGGGRGNDTLIGRDGADLLFGDRGNDRLFGGDGRDNLDSGLGSGTLACGDGRDRVSRPQFAGVLPASCEYVVDSFDSEAQVPARPRRTRAGLLALRLTCPLAYAACSGAIHLREEGGQRRLLAMGPFSHGGRDGHSFIVRLALTTLGYRWLAGRLGHGSATVTLRVGIGVAAPSRLRWRIRATDIS